MLLTADVGNTNIKIGIFDENKLKFKFRFSTDKSKTSDEFAVELYSFFLIYGLNAKKLGRSCRDLSAESCDTNGYGSKKSDRRSRSQNRNGSQNRPSRNLGRRHCVRLCGRV